MHGQCYLTGVDSISYGHSAAGDLDLRPIEIINRSTIQLLVICLGLNYACFSSKHSEFQIGLLYTAVLLEIQKQIQGRNLVFRVLISTHPQTPDLRLCIMQIQTLDMD